MPHPPKIDLHRHLDGNVRLTTILEVGEIHHLPLPGTTVDSLRPHVVIDTPQPGLMEFLAKFEWMTRILVTPDVCYRVARENVEDAANEMIDYLELRFSPIFMALPHGLHPGAVCEAVAQGVADGARDFNVETRLIGILSRTFGVESCHRELDALLTIRDQLVAVDLAGDEARFPPALFVPHFRKVRDAGLQVTIHAGEAAGAPGVLDAIDLLGATRIGHAVRAIDDPAVVKRLIDDAIGVECNLTSNVQTSTVESLATHPLKKFLDAGILATINTDDPGISGIDLSYELDVAAPAAGLTDDDILRARQNAAVIAFGYRSRESNASGE